MNDREAMLALAEPVPEVRGRWFSVEGETDRCFVSNADDVARRDAQHDRYLAAVAHVREGRA